MEKLKTAWESSYGKIKIKTNVIKWGYLICHYSISHTLYSNAERLHLEHSNVMENLDNFTNALMIAV